MACLSCVPGKMCKTSTGRCKMGTTCRDSGHAQQRGHLLRTVYGAKLRKKGTGKSKSSHQPRCVCRLGFGSAAVTSTISLLQRQKSTTFRRFGDDAAERLMSKPITPLSWRGWGGDRFFMRSFGMYCAVQKSVTPTGTRPRLRAGLL